MENASFIAKQIQCIQPIQERRDNEKALQELVDSHNKNHFVIRTSLGPLPCCLNELHPAVHNIRLSRQIGPEIRTRKDHKAIPIPYNASTS